MTNLNFILVLIFVQQSVCYQCLWYFVDMTHRDTALSQHKLHVCYLGFGTSDVQTRSENNSVSSVSICRSYTHKEDPTSPLILAAYFILLFASKKHTDQCLVQKQQMLNDSMCIKYVHQQRIISKQYGKSIHLRHSIWYQPDSI